MMKRLSFKEKARFQRHREIITTAARIMHREGSRALTMERVAAEVGISKSTLYQDISSKEALIEQVILESLTHLGEALRQPDLSPLRRISLFLEAAFDWNDDLRCLATQALREGSALSPLAQARIHELLQRLEETCIAGQADGSIRTRWSGRSIAYLLLTTAAGSSVGRAFFSEPHTEWSQILLHGIAS